MLFRNNGKLAELPFRQIHMDFHTSELIDNVGAEFDAEEFADTLAKARVDQVCCFARCHHGWLYYDSIQNPERIHPTLVNRNILAEQVEACHKRGIRVPIYTTIQWDHYSAQRHADWLCRDSHGRTMSMVDKGMNGFYTYLCVNNEDYLSFLEAHITDIYRCIPSVDGIFLDIVWPIPCACPNCCRLMESEGLDVASADHRWKNAIITLDRFTERMSSFIRRLDPNGSVYFNNGAVWPNHRTNLGAFTHLEFDALPGESPRGYSHIHSRRFERNLGLDCVAMTGKFHRGWGDFHSFKNREALEYECFQALSLNLKCLVGDQLAPNGRIEHAVYDLVGAVYAEVEKKEPWCRGAKAVSEIGVVASGRNCTSGAISMLVSAGHQFEVIDEQSDLSAYKVVILPDRLKVSPAFAAALDSYIESGGRVLCSFEACFDSSSKRFLLEHMPVKLESNGPLYEDGMPVRGRYLGRTEYADYVIPTVKIGVSLPKTEHVMYARGVEVAAADGAEVLVNQVKPVFARTQQHFSSHQQSPSSGETGYPAVVQRGNIIYFGHPIFDIYNEYAPRWCKVMALDALKLLLPDPVLTHDGPSTLEATVNCQTAEDRWIVHLLHYIPLNRAERLAVVEDIIPLHNITVSLKTPRPVRSVRAVPSGEPGDFVEQSGRTEILVPLINGHQMLEVNFK